MDKVAFTVADEKNMEYAKMMVNSLRKFHDEKELPLEIIGPKELEKRLVDPYFFYRATPIIADELFEKGYKTVIKIDADSIVCGDLSKSWDNKEVDASVVLNTNPREWKNFQYTIWDIPPVQYINNGYVVVRNPHFAKHWRALCEGPHFPPYQMKEQDLLNIICHYGDYMVNLMDSSDSLWGLSSKGYWQDIELRKGELVLDPVEDKELGTYPISTKKIKIIHWAGGADAPDKMNYRTKFKPEVVKWLKKIVK